MVPLVFLSSFLVSAEKIISPARFSALSITPWKVSCVFLPLYIQLDICFFAASSARPVASLVFFFWFFLAG